MENKVITYEEGVGITIRVPLESISAVDAVHTVPGKSFLTFWSDDGYYFVACQSSEGAKELRAKLRKAIKEVSVEVERG